MLKTCILTSVHPVFDTRIFHKEAKTLLAAGYDVSLVAQNTKNETIEGIKIIPLPKTKNRLQRMIMLPYKIIGLALKERADIYHIHDPELTVVGLLLKIFRKRIIYDMHENLPKQVFSKEWIAKPIRGIISGLIYLYEKIILSNFLVIFAELSYQKDYSWIKNSVVVLNLPMIDLVKNKTNAKKSIVYLGGVSEMRGSVTIIESLVRLNTKGYDIPYECVGPIENKHKNELLELCEKYGLRKVTFHGRLAAKDAWDIVSVCSIGLAVLKPIPNYIESYPTKMFEYMALGLPVVVSNFALYKNIVETEKCGFCVDPLDTKAIADAIQWLLEHPKEAEEMGRNGQKAVRGKYNWDNEAKKLLDFYENVIPKK